MKSSTIVFFLFVLVAFIPPSSQAEQKNGKDSIPSWLRSSDTDQPRKGTNSTTNTNKNIPSWLQAKQQPSDNKQTDIIILETSQGIIKIKLMPEVAPKACENFVGLVTKGYYNGTIFHRVIEGFMIQGGGPGGTSIWGKPFEDEVSTNVRFDRKGLLAMANRGPNTNGSQFFITTAKAPHLNMKYTIFGEVVAGYEAVEKISHMKVDARHKPLQEQKIVKAYRDTSALAGPGSINLVERRVVSSSQIRLELLPFSDTGMSVSTPVSQAGEIMKLGIPVFIESLYVYAKGKTVISTVASEDEKPYRIEARGSVNLGSNTNSKFINADAGYVFGAGYATSWANSTLPALSGTLGINGQGMRPKERYNTIHEYSQDIEGDGKSFEFKVLDTSYRDNGGHLLVSIYRLLDFRLAATEDEESREVRALVEQGKLNKAIEYVENGLRANRDDSDLLNLIGILFLKASEMEKTEGLAIATTDNLGRAFSNLKKALAGKKLLAILHNNLGVAYRKAGDKERARSEFNTSLSLNPGFETALYNLSLLDEEERIRPVVGKPSREKVRLGKRKK